MRAAFILIAIAVLAVSSSEAGLAEKVSEDDNFVVYRIPVRALDLQTDATGHHEGYELSPSYGRSSSKSSSHSKSSSSSTGTGKGKGYGEGSLSKGYGEGHGGSSGGHGYGSGGHGYGSGGSGYGSGGSGYGSGGSGGHGYGSGGSGYGSGGQGYGSGGHGYGSGGSGYGSGGQGYGGSYRGGYSPSYGPSYSPSYGPSHGPGYDSAPHYDDEEGGHDGPKVITTTKTVTTNSAQDTGLDKLKDARQQYRQPSDSLGDIRFKLADYLKNTPGHELSKYFEAAQSELNPGYRSGQQGFNVNEFTRTLNQGIGQAAFTSPSYRNNRFLPQASIIIPKAYAFRHSGFGLPGF